MAGRHLKPINRRGRKRRILKTLPSLSCNWPEFGTEFQEKTIDAAVEKKQKEKVAA